MTTIQTTVEGTPLERLAAIHRYVDEASSTFALTEKIPRELLSKAFNNGHLKKKIYHMARPTDNFVDSDKYDLVEWTQDDFDNSLAENPVVYQLGGKTRKYGDSGRYYPEGANNLVYMQRKLRHALLPTSVEFDAKSCMPSTFANLLDIYDIHCPDLKLFLNNRDAFLKGSGMVKGDFLKMLLKLGTEDWGKPDTEHKPSRKIFDAMKMLAKRLVNEDHPLFQGIKSKLVWSGKGKDYNPIGKFMSIIYQTYETVFIRIAMDVVQEHDMHIHACIYDGILVERGDKSDDELDAICKLIGARINEELGFGIKFAVKDLRRDLDDDEIVDLDVVVRESWKEIGDKFLETHRCFNWDFFADLVARHTGKEQLDKRAATYYIGHFLRLDMKTSTYIRRFRVDEPWEAYVKDVKFMCNSEEKTVLKYAPKCEGVTFDFTKPQWGTVLDNGAFEHFNAFSGFKARLLDRRVEEHEVKMYLDYIHDVICCANQDPEREQYYRWVLRWIQKLFTECKPNEMCLVLFGKEGAGKGFFFTSLGKHLIGERYCLEINNFADFIAQPFNSQLENKLLVHIDEVPVESEKAKQKTWDKFKNMVTSEGQNIRKMYTEAYGTRNVNSFGLVTNNLHVLPLTDTSRRIMMLKQSNARRNDGEFFARLDAFMGNHANEIFTYFHQVDLSDVPFNTMKKTAECKRVTSSGSRPVEAFIKMIQDHKAFPEFIKPDKTNGENFHPHYAPRGMTKVPAMSLYKTFKEYVGTVYPNTKLPSYKLFIGILAEEVHNDENGRSDMKLVRKQKRTAKGIAYRINDGVRQDGDADDDDNDD